MCSGRYSLQERWKQMISIKKPVHFRRDENKWFLLRNLFTSGEMKTNDFFLTCSLQHGNGDTEEWSGPVGYVHVGNACMIDEIKPFPICYLSTSTSQWGHTRLGWTRRIWLGRYSLRIENEKKVFSILYLSTSLEQWGHWAFNPMCTFFMCVSRLSFRSNAYYTLCIYHCQNDQYTFWIFCFCSVFKRQFLYFWTECALVLRRMVASHVLCLPPSVFTLRPCHSTQVTLKEYRRVSK